MIELIEGIFEITIIILFDALIAALIVLACIVLIKAVGRIIENEIIAKMIKKHVQDRR